MLDILLTPLDSTYTTTLYVIKTPPYSFHLFGGVIWLQQPIEWVENECVWRVCDCGQSNINVGMGGGEDTRSRASRRVPERCVSQSQIVWVDRYVDAIYRIYTAYSPSVCSQPFFFSIRMTCVVFLDCLYTGPHARGQLSRQRNI